MALKPGILVKDGKQMGYPQIGSLYTAGDYIAINNDEISVNPVVPNEEATYQIVSDGQEGGTYFVRINKIVDGEVVLTERYSTVDNIKHTFDDTIRIDYANTVSWNFTYELLVASTTHDAGYTYSWGYAAQVDIDEVVVIADHSGENLVLKAQMDTALSGKQDTLTFDDTPTDNSNNPVKSNGVYDALALKQDKTDNTLQTTDKTVVGAVNELKSGLTNLDNEVNGDATVYPYADVITINDAIPANLADCTVKIEPVQDLHGYDKPWVGGAGDNKLYINPDFVFPYSNNGITITSDGNGGVYINGTTTDGVIMGTPIFKTDNLTGQNTLCKLSSEEVSTGSVVYEGHYPNGNYYSGVNGYDTVNTDGYWSIKLYFPNAGRTFNNVHLQPMVIMGNSHPTEYIPYENICPISGSTESVVTRDGKNLFNKDDINSFNGYISTSHNIYMSEAQYKMCYIECKPNTEYTISKIAGKTFRVASSVNAPSNDVPYINTEANHTGTSIVITTGANAKYLAVLYWSSVNGDTLTPAEIESTIQIEYGSSATDYEPFRGKTYTIQLGDTIYGGTVDFDSGVMTVTYVSDVLTSSFTILKSSTTDMDVYLITLNDGDLDPSTLLNCFNYVSGVDTHIVGEAWRGSSGKQLRIAFASYGTSTVESFKDWVDNNTVQVCYKLATPTTVQLTPEQIQLLKGQNTLTASTGQISVTVNGVSGAIGSVQTQANATDAALSELAADIAEKLPTAPTTDGAYVLTVTVADGMPTYSWESAT